MWRIKISPVVAGLLLVTSVPAEAIDVADNWDRYSEGLYIGMASDMVSLSINSKTANHDTVTFHSGAWQATVFYRSPFHPFERSTFGYYFEYGFNSFGLRQGAVWDPGSSTEIDPNQSIHGWYAYAYPMVAMRSKGLTIGLGLGMTLIDASGGFAVSWLSPASLSYEQFAMSKLALSTRLFIEGEKGAWVWGMRMHQVKHSDASFNYNMNFVVLYLGMHL